MFPEAYGRGKRTKTDILGDAPAVKSKIVARNTVEWTDESGARYIRLHDTDVLTFRPNGSIEINTGGWNTPTTRDRLNSFLPDDWRVYTHKGVLHLSGDNRGGIVKIRPFRQRATIGPRKGITVDDGINADQDRKVIDAYMKAVKEMGELPKPAAGDPRVAPDKVTGKYAESHVRGWLDEKYIFGSFIVAAGRYAGLQDLGIAYTMFSGKSEIAQRRIRRYIRACLGYGT